MGKQSRLGIFTVFFSFVNSSPHHSWVNFVITHSVISSVGFPDGSVIKNLPADAWVGKIPWEGNGNRLQYSYLGNPMDRGAWQATIHRVPKSYTQLSVWACMISNVFWGFIIFSEPPIKIGFFFFQFIPFFNDVCFIKVLASCKILDFASWLTSWTSYAISPISAVCTEGPILLKWGPPPCAGCCQSPGASFVPCTPLTGSPMVWWTT